MATVSMQTASRLSDILPLQFLQNMFTRSRRQKLLYLQCAVARQRRALLWQLVRNVCTGVGANWLPSFCHSYNMGSSSSHTVASPY